MYIEELYDEEKISSYLVVSHAASDMVMVGITDHCTGNSQAFKFLAVVCARLGAVIRHEDHLLSCGDYQPPPFADLRINAHHCFGEAPVSPLFRGRGGRRTIEHLNYHGLSGCCDAAGWLRGTSAEGQPG